MAWSSDDVVCEHRETKSTTAALDYNGRYMVLAGRLGISAIDLNSPQTVIRKLNRKSKWEVSVIRWNHHSQYRDLIAVGSNQKVDLLHFEYGTLDLIEPVQHHSIRGHARAVLDLDWNFAEPTLLVTCSVDNYVNIWDIRDVRKPVAGLPSVSGASQAKWAKIGKHYLATAHEADCKIWDFRKAPTPVEYITAHSAKINGIDWSSTNGNSLVTCGQDCNVKVWDITVPKKPEITISVSAPVWRARFTPFGEGLVTVGIPQLHRGDTSLALWALHDVAVPVHLYSGHTEGVYDFFWRSLHGVEFQLLSWSKDQTLRLWKTESNIVKQCGSAYLNHTIVLDHHTDSHYGKENLSTNSAVFSDGISPPHPITSSSPLDKELRSIDVANVVVEDIDVKLRSCTVFVTVGHHVAKIMMSFPLGYPEISCPNFFIAPETTLNPISLRQVTQMLTDVFNRCLKNQATSVAAGVRAISQFLGTLSSDASLSPRLDGHPVILSPTARPQPAIFKVGGPARLIAQRNESHSPLISAATAKLFGNTPTSFTADVPIPFPRICGACFAGDKLVMWSDAWKLGFPSNGSKSMMDRSLSGVFPSELSVRQRQVRKALKKKGKPEQSSITIFSVESLLPVHPVLLANYLNDSYHPVESLLRNAEIAESVDRRDLAEVWQLLAVISKPGDLPSSDVDDAPWYTHPFGRLIVENIAAMVMYKDLIICDPARIEVIHTLGSYQEFSLRICTARWLRDVLTTLVLTGITHFRNNYDCAFLATLACIFCRFPCSQKRPQPGRTTKSASVLHLDTHSPSHTVLSDESCDGWSQVVSRPFKDKQRSSSWTTSTSDDPRKTADTVAARGCSEELLNPEKREDLDLFKREYCELLYSFRLLNKRAEILKCLGHPPDPQRGVEFHNTCHNCGCEVRGSRCFRCKNIAVSCAVCHCPVKGLSTFCFSCGHGGHLLHVEEWFKTRSSCPSGCGCACIEVMDTLCRA